MFMVIIQGLCVVVSLYSAYKLCFALRHFTIPMPPPSLPKEVPSVSVCIPARNETHAMTRCLESVIASTYPKLEIIVLDDASTDNTSMLIKSFAHAGVRFVQGNPLPDGWLGKNHAYEELLHEASGAYVVFMDVDTQVLPRTIEYLVAYAEAERASMVSVAPFRADTWRPSVLLSTMRYFWTIILHKSSLPATTGTAWLVQRRLLKEYYQGFNRVKQMVQPEEYFAADLASKDAYRFVLGSQTLGLSYEKKWRSQIETGLRLLWPMLGGTALGAVMGMGILLLVLSPTLVLVSSLWWGWSFVQTLALVQHGVFCVLYGVYASRMWTRNGWLGALLLPLVVIQELLLLVGSVIGYMRHTITWKGRPVFVGARATARK